MHVVVCSAMLLSVVRASPAPIVAVSRKAGYVGTLSAQYHR